MGLVVVVVAVVVVVVVAVGVAAVGATDPQMVPDTRRGAAVADALVPDTYFSKPFVPTGKLPSHCNATDRTQDVSHEHVTTVGKMEPRAFYMREL